MTDIIASLRYNLSNLFRFSGRDRPGQFWPYAIFMFVLSMISAFLIMIPMLVDMMVRAGRYIEAHPEGLPEASAGPYGVQPLPPELMPDMASIMLPLAIVNGLFALLLAAAIVRRLHDRDTSGYWALLPVPFMVMGQVLAPAAMQSFSPGPGQDPTAFLLSGLNSALYWIAVVVLVVMLVQAGTRGPNRFGPEPPPVA